MKRMCNHLIMHMILYRERDGAAQPIASLSCPITGMEMRAKVVAECNRLRITSSITWKSSFDNLFRQPSQTQLLSADVGDPAVHDVSHP